MMSSPLSFMAGISLGITITTCILLNFHEQYQFIVNKKKKKIEATTLCEPAKDSLELQQEQFSRIETYFGPEGFQNLRHAFVIVIGLGGVGSHAAQMLARSGVKKLRLIDFDNVTLSSLNRHAVATREDVGTPKVVATAKHLHKIVPSCEIESVVEMFQENTIARHLNIDNQAERPTYVIDAIDDVKTKSCLLAAAVQHGLRVITATGAGGKADPTRICIGSLADATQGKL